MWGCWSLMSLNCFLFAFIDDILISLIWHTMYMYRAYILVPGNDTYTVDSLCKIRFPMNFGLLNFVEGPVCYKLT